MRISSGERGGPFEEPGAAGGEDAQATQPVTRGRLDIPAPPDAEPTDTFAREDPAPPPAAPAGPAPGPPPAAPAGPTPGPSAAVPDPPDPGATRRFVRAGTRPGRGPDFEEAMPAPRRGKGRGGSGPAAPRRRRRFRLRWLAAVLLLVALLVPLLTWTAVWYTARQDERTPSDAIVVMGASQYDGRPSAIFEARLGHAAELYHEGVAPAIVTVGGSLPGDNFTEGEAGRNWLVEQGIPPEHVVAVPEGTDSLDSLEAVGGAFSERQWSSAVIVTDPWHALRSKVIASDTGIEAATSPVRTGPAVYTRETQLWYITRESASLLYYWSFGESAGVRVEAV